MAGIINRLIEGAFAFTIVAVFIWFVVAKVMRKPMFGLFEKLKVARATIGTATKGKPWKRKVGM